MSKDYKMSEEELLQLMRDGKSVCDECGTIFKWHETRHCPKCFDLGFMYTIEVQFNVMNIESFIEESEYNDKVLMNAKIHRVYIAIIKEMEKMSKITPEELEEKFPYRVFRFNKYTNKKTGKWVLGGGKYLDEI